MVALDHPAGSSPNDAGQSSTFPRLAVPLSRVLRCRTGPLPRVRRRFRSRRHTRTGNSPMAMLRPLAPPELSPSGMAAQRIRRCTYRRLIQLDVGAERVSDMAFLFPYMMLLVT